MKYLVNHHQKHSKKQKQKKELSTQVWGLRLKNSERGINNLLIIMICAIYYTTLQAEKKEREITKGCKFCRIQK